MRTGIKGSLVSIGSITILLMLSACGSRQALQQAAQDILDAAAKKDSSNDTSGNAPSGSSFSDLSGTWKVTTDLGTDVTFNVQRDTVTYLGKDYFKAISKVDPHKDLRGIRVDQNKAVVEFLVAYQTNMTAENPAGYVVSSVPITRQDSDEIEISEKGRFITLSHLNSVIDPLPANAFVFVDAYTNAVQDRTGSWKVTDRSTWNSEESIAMSVKALAEFRENITYVRAVRFFPDNTVLVTFFRASNNKDDCTVISKKRISMIIECLHTQSGNPQQYELTKIGGFAQQ